MKTRILIYGDSNTWGDEALHRGRYETHEQWPDIFQHLLGDEYEVIQEGLCGRIAGDHDTADAYRNGRVGYEIALRSACPVQYVIVAPGTNDAKPRYNLSIDDIVADLAWYDKRTQEYARDDKDMTDFHTVIYLGAANFKSNDHFNPPEGYADDLNRSLREAGKDVIVPPRLEHVEDGLHYSREDHKRVAQKVYEKFKEMERR